jgi:acyl carrier protein
MVPTAWIELTELPRTPQGKVDRRVLPDPDWAVSATSAGYVEPVEELERQVAGVFERVLGIDRVGIGDDFFELGGHSLLATRAVSQLRRELKVEISLRELFEHPSVGELSTTLRDRLQVAVQGGTNTVEIARAGREGRRIQSAVLEEEEMSV